MAPISEFKLTFALTSSEVTRTSPFISNLPSRDNSGGSVFPNTFGSRFFNSRKVTETRSKSPLKRKGLLVLIEFTIVKSPDALIPFLEFRRKF